jgi:uncharacterized SAM-binding protein YcdF (DUF218 family)
MTPLTDRERFLALCYNGPLHTADAIVVLAGEDAPARAQVAAGLFRGQAAPFALVVGRAATEGPHYGAEETAGMLRTQGVAPARIEVDATAAHTGEQAARIVATARERRWKRILLVASAYHVPRAMLTVVAAMARAGLETLHVVPVPAAHAPWFQSPHGMDATRMDRFARELEKCETYDGVATWAEGLAYGQRWGA